MKKKKIYVYAISKNEEKFAKRWYESVKSADGIYVLDTGSTDNTVKILSDMAQNDKSRNGADAATAASILMKMSSPTKLVDVPKGNNPSGGMIE